MVAIQGVEGVRKIEIQVRDDRAIVIQQDTEHWGLQCVVLQPSMVDDLLRQLREVRERLAADRVTVK